MNHNTTSTSYESMFEKNILSQIESLITLSKLSNSPNELSIKEIKSNEPGKDILIYIRTSFTLKLILAFKIYNDNVRTYFFDFDLKLTNDENINQYKKYRYYLSINEQQFSEIYQEIVHAMSKERMI